MDWQTIKDTTGNIYSYLEDILVIKEYEINQEDDLITKTEMFILRYRRILGIILLCILLYIWYKCNIYTNNVVQRGGDDKPDFSFSGSPEATKARLANEAIESKIRAEHEQKKKESTIKAKLEKEDSNKAEAEKKKKDEAAAANKEKDLEAAKAARKSMSRWDKAKEKGKLQEGALKDKLGKTSIGKFVGKQKGEMSEMRKAGFTKTQARAKMLYNVGAAAGEKFKEFAGWLYEILFAIAISIAICMVVLPSLSFFIVGLICYFLLKSKISSLKSA